MPKTKSLVRSLSRRGVRSDMSPPVGGVGKTRQREPAACERCGATYVRRTWRRDRAVTHDLLTRATWTVCPACRQAGSGEYWGRVLVRGAFVPAHESDIRRRISNVAERAARSQPLRRVLAIDRRSDGLEVLTTSQKLAHRIVHELKKLYRGRAHYCWSDDGSLFATWQRER